MRLWSLSPEYLDPQGLVALWREALLAQKVLRGRTKGYRRHPQLSRFRDQKNPASAIGAYLNAVWVEAKKRGYSFKRSKIKQARSRTKICVSKGQLNYEFKWLCSKLKSRDLNQFSKIKQVKKINPNPVFKIVNGGIESWEKVK